jgi:hypothetical protein
MDRQDDAVELAVAGSEPRILLVEGHHFVANAGSGDLAGLSG